MNTGLFALSTVKPRSSMAALHAPCGGFPGRLHAKGCRARPQTSACTRSIAQDLKPLLEKGR
jgi:hypothetical protein